MSDRKLFVVELYATAEENGSTKRLVIPVRALNDKMAILAATVHVTALGMQVVAVEDSVAQFLPTNGVWYYS